MCNRRQKSGERQANVIGITTMKIRCTLLVMFLAMATATACSSQKEAAPATPPAASSADDAPIPATASPFDALPEGLQALMDKPFTGDFDELVKRRAIRAAVTYNRTHYFIDEGQERGLA